MVAVCQRVFIGRLITSIIAGGVSVRWDDSILVCSKLEWHQIAGVCRSIVIGTSADMVGHWRVT